MAEATYTDLMNNNTTTPLFGQLMLRDTVLPTLLGKQTSSILYFAGRDLAMQMPTSDDDIPAVFTAMGLGTLASSQVKVKLRTYTLTGPEVSTRTTNFKEPDFQFEAGLLAQLIQQNLGMTTEANSQTDRRGATVTITVSIDPSEEQPVFSTTTRDR